jgi:hypothetical protein
MGSRIIIEGLTYKIEMLFLSGCKTLRYQDIQISLKHKLIDYQDFV